MCSRLSGNVHDKMMQKITRNVQRLAGTPFTIWSLLGRLGLERYSTASLVGIMMVTSSEILTNHALYPERNDATYQRFLERQGMLDLKKTRQRSSTCRQVHGDEPCGRFLFRFWFRNAWLAVRIYCVFYGTNQAIRFLRGSRTFDRMILIKIARSTAFLATFCNVGACSLCLAHRTGTLNGPMIRLYTSTAGLALLLEEKSRHAALVRYIMTYAAVSWLKRTGVELPGPFRGMLLWSCYGTWLMRFFGNRKSLTGT